MPNEMIRPCTWAGKTFDATTVIEIAYHPYYFADTGVRKLGAYIHLNERVEIKSHMVDTFEEARPIVLGAITTIANALNAPVLATEEVLAGLPKDAKLMTRTHFVEQGVSGYWGYWEPNDNGDFDLEPVMGERIKSNGCPKTAEYLRQFTLDGVRIKEGG